MGFMGFVEFMDFEAGNPTNLIHSIQPYKHNTMPCNANHTIHNITIS